MFFNKFQELKLAGDFKTLHELIPYAGLVGLDFENTPLGPITILRAKESNTGNTLIPAVHGGVVGALLEHAASMQILWEIPIQRFPKPINVSIDYLRPCIAGRDTYARATLVKQGKSVINVHVEAWQSTPQKLLASANAHFKV